jgi:hypothetical protein
MQREAMGLEELRRERQKLKAKAERLESAIAEMGHSPSLLDWVGMNVEPPDLERLSGLAHLKELHLPGPIWNRNADNGRDGSRDLRFGQARRAPIRPSFPRSNPRPTD